MKALSGMAAGLLMAMFLLSAPAQAEKNRANIAGSTAAFTGSIDAIYEYRYLKVVTREQIGFIVDHDAIQRVTYSATDHLRGITVYPNDKKVILFRQRASLKYYVVIALEEYENEIRSLRDRVEIADDEQLGFSSHFLLLNHKKTQQQPDFKPIEFDPEQCSGHQWKTPAGGSDQVYNVEMCRQLDIPQAWLTYTDLGIPATLNGFPFLFVKSVQDNAATQTSVFDGFGVKKIMDEGSTVSRIVDATGKSLRKVGRAMSELEEFHYRVVKVVPGPVTKTSIEKWRGFTKLATLRAFLRVFSETPETEADTSSGRSHRSHNWFD